MVICAAGIALEAHGSMQVVRYTTRECFTKCNRYFSVGKNVIEETGSVSASSTPLKRRILALRLGLRDAPNHTYFTTVAKSRRIHVSESKVALPLLNFISDANPSIGSS